MKLFVMIIIIAFLAFTTHVLNDLLEEVIRKRISPEETISKEILRKGVDRKGIDKNDCRWRTERLYSALSIISAAFLGCACVAFMIEIFRLSEQTSLVLLPVILFAVGDCIFICVRKKQIREETEKRGEDKRQKEYHHLLGKYQNLREALDGQTKEYDRYFNGTGKQRRSAEAVEAARIKHQTESLLREIEQKMKRLGFKPPN